MTILLILLLGFILLIKGADLFVEKASVIAFKFNMSPILIGLTIVAMGTSAPEAATTMASALAGKNAMSISNVIGSNLFNILIVLGVLSLITNLRINKDEIKFEMPFLLFISFLLLLFNLDLSVALLRVFYF